MRAIVFPKVARFFFISGVLISLAGCATVLVETGRPAAWPLDPRPESWAMQGRISVKVGSEGWHGKIDWSRSVGRDLIKISGPLGQGAIRISMNGEGVEVLHHDGRKEFSTSSRELVEKYFGFSVPLEALSQWIAGVPGREGPYQLLDKNLEQIEFAQSGWKIFQNDWREYWGGRMLPRKLKITKDSILVRLVVDRWGGV